MSYIDIWGLIVVPILCISALVAQAGLFFDSFRRMSELETQQPRWKIELESARAAMEDLLETAEGKLRRSRTGRAAMDRKAAQVAAEAAPAIPIDPRARRAMDLAQVRARLGG